MSRSTENRAVPRQLGRQSLRGLSLYDATAQCRIDLSDNTNQWGAPPAARSVIENADTWLLSRYPAPYARELKNAFATYLDVDPTMIVSGCGSDDLLDSAIRAFAEPGDRLAHFVPTFGMVSVFSTVNSVTAVGVSRKDSSAVDALLGTGARIIYLCSPNNPTGEVLRREVIETVVSSAAGLVILDEAYAEFAGVSSIDLLSRYDNLLITRTLSKAFGLAGLRIGYAAGAPAVVAEVEKSRGPYKVNSLAEQAAIAALTNDLDWVNENVRTVLNNRELFGQRLRDLGLAPIESGANFLLVPVADAKQIQAALATNGIGVRAFENLDGIGDALRITVGPWPLMQECLAALEQAIR